MALSAGLLSLVVAALLPPQPLTPTSIAYPAQAPPLSAPARVQVDLLIDAEGEVARVTLVQSSSVAAFDSAVLEGAARFRFEPATLDGAPVPVQIPFTQTFEPPAAPVTTSTEAAPRRTAVLAGRLEETGTRAPVRFAQLDLRCEGSLERVEASSDAGGNFAARVPACELQVNVRAPGFEPFRQVEAVHAFERLEVGYLLVRRTRDPYEVTVYGERQAEELSRTTLRGREIHQIPGTFGDPFRVVQTLPGVANMFSLLPFPVVRGSSPGNTGFLIDGVRVPLLFHLLAGPSVMHPEFIAEIDFMPGAYSVEHGGYTGGIVNGRTRRPGPRDDRLEMSGDLVHVGGFARHTFDGPGLTVTGAARYGYPGLLISLIDPDNSLTYWDYQARVDGGDRSSGWSVFAFGASDDFASAPEPGEPVQPVLRMQFHRVDLRYARRDAEGWDEYQLALGFDATDSDEGIEVRSLSATPRMRWMRKLASTLRVRMSIEGFARQNRTELDEDNPDLRMIFGEAPPERDALFAAQSSIELLWRPHPRLLIRPGLRTDVYDTGEALQASVDPRLLWRLRLAGDPQRPLALKGGVGLYHQPPRFVVPLPGLDQVAFERGLLESIQTSLGLEVPLGLGFEVDVQGYFNFTDPIIFDVQANVPAIFPGIEQRTAAYELVTTKGRAFGLELLVRRRSATGIFGWLSYTLSRTERWTQLQWVAFDFDRTHIFNAVVGLPLPRGWSIGARLLAQSGRPLTTTRGPATARTAPFVRFDVRIDKRAAWRDWLLEFYVDINNLTLAAEEVEAGYDLRYVLPTIGLRAIF